MMRKKWYSGVCAASEQLGTASPGEEDLSISDDHKGVRSPDRQVLRYSECDFV